MRWQRNGPGSTLLPTIYHGSPAPFPPPRWPGGAVRRGARAAEGDAIDAADNDGHGVAIALAFPPQFGALIGRRNARRIGAAENVGNNWQHYRGVSFAAVARRRGARGTAAGDRRVSA